MRSERLLVVTADDYGIGPETSRGILELGGLGAITATVLLANSPYVEEAVVQWRKSGRRLTLGWHPCLTLDGPVLAPERVPSLVDSVGKFHPRATLLRRLALGKINAGEVRTEWAAQLQRACELIGGPPTVVNGHHHLHVFPVLGPILRDLLSKVRPAPYLRRVGEPIDLLLRIPGATIKRLALGALGRLAAGPSRRKGFPGNDWLAGVTDPPSATDPENFTRWLLRTPGKVVELMCHPGYYDATLLSRDSTPTDGWLNQRVQELSLLKDPQFGEAYRRAGFRLASPMEVQGVRNDSSRDAA